MNQRSIIYKSIQNEIIISGEFVNGLRVFVNHFKNTDIKHFYYGWFSSPSMRANMLYTQLRAFIFLSLGKWIGECGIAYYFS